MRSLLDRERFTTYQERSRHSRMLSSKTNLVSSDISVPGKLSDVVTIKPGTTALVLDHNVSKPLWRNDRHLVDNYKTCILTLAVTYHSKRSGSPRGAANEIEAQGPKHRDLRHQYIYVSAQELLVYKDRIPLNFSISRARSSSKPTKDAEAAVNLFQPIVSAIKHGNSTSVHGSSPEMEKLDRLYNLYFLVLVDKFITSHGEQNVKF